MINTDNLRQVLLRHGLVTREVADSVAAFIAGNQTFTPGAAAPAPQPAEAAPAAPRKRRAPLPCVPPQQGRAPPPAPGGVAWDAPSACAGPASWQGPEPCACLDLAAVSAASSCSIPEHSLYAAFTQKVCRVAHDTVQRIQGFAVDSGCARVCRMRFEERAEHAQNAAGRALLQLMARKRSNLAVAADVASFEKVLAIADAAGPHIAVLKTHVDMFETWDARAAARLRALADKHGARGRGLARGLRSRHSCGALHGVIGRLPWCVCARLRPSVTP